MISNLSRMFGFTCLALLCACSGDDETTGDAWGEKEAHPIAVIEDRLDATNTQDWDRWEALHTPDAIRTAPELAEPLEGAAAMRAAIPRRGSAGRVSR